MGRLLDRSEIDIRYIHSNVTSDVLDPFIREAEDYDIKPFLGDELYYALVTAAAESPIDTIYDDLLNGVDYSYGANTIEFLGLKKAIQYYAYARWLVHHDVSHTPVGLVIHTDDHSERPTDVSIKIKITQARSAASQILEDTRKYLNENSSLYELWGCAGTIRRGIRLRIVGKNNRYGSNGI